MGERFLHCSSPLCSSVVARLGDPGASTIETDTTQADAETSTSTSSLQDGAPPEQVSEIGRRSITVGGVGTMYAEPVRSVLDLGVGVRRSTVGESTRVAAESADAMREALYAMGVEPESVQTTDFVVGPFYEDWPTISGYETSITYRVVVSDIGEVGAVLAAATRAGGDDVRAVGIRFEADAAALTDQAREEAWADVTHRAKETARLAAVTLGNVLDSHEKVLVSTSRGLYQGGEGDSASFDIPVSPGVTGVVVLLTVEFEIDTG